MKPQRSIAKFAVWMVAVGTAACATSPAVEYRKREPDAGFGADASLAELDSSVDASGPALPDTHCDTAEGLCLRGKLSLGSLDAMQAEWDATSRVLDVLAPIARNHLYVAHCFHFDQYTVDKITGQRVPSEFGAVLYTFHPSCPIRPSGDSHVLSAPKEDDNTAKWVDAATSSSDDLVSTFIQVAGALELDNPILTKVGLRFTLDGPLGGVVEARLTRNGHLLTKIENPNSAFESENTAASQAMCEFYRELE